MQCGDDPEQAAGVREGQVLAGKYRVERILGVGGMGVVVAASNVQLDTRVALKFLLPTVLSNEEAVARFTREARAAPPTIGTALPPQPHPSAAPTQHPSPPQNLPNCDPNYELDSRGEKRFKPECFGVPASSTRRK